MGMYFFFVSSLLLSVAYLLWIVTSRPLFHVQYTTTESIGHMFFLALFTKVTAV